MRPSTQLKPTPSAGCPYYYPKRMAGARAQVDTIKIPDQNAEFLMEQNNNKNVIGQIFFVWNNIFWSEIGPIILFPVKNFESVT